MTNFERIKTLSIEEMTKFIDAVDSDEISTDFCANRMCGCKCDEQDDCVSNCSYSEMVKLWLNHEETGFWEKEE